MLSVLCATSRSWKSLRGDPSSERCAVFVAKPGNDICPVLVTGGVVTTRLTGTCMFPPSSPSAGAQKFLRAICSCRSCEVGGNGILAYNKAKKHVLRQLFTIAERSLEPCTHGLYMTIRIRAENHYRSKYSLCPFSCYNRKAEVEQEPQKAKQARNLTYSPRTC